MMSKIIKFPHKQIRSFVIREYMSECGTSRAVCFTCGNAGRELRDAGVDVLIIGNGGELLPNKWFTQADIRRYFPDYFDATSGHLDMTLMKRIGRAYRDYLGELPDEVTIPSGSGETAVCLKLAYPNVKITALYDIDEDGLREATEYSPDAPLNGIVSLIAKVEHGVDYND